MFIDPLTYLFNSLSVPGVQVAIMAVGSIQRLPRFAADGKTVVPASIINLSLGADHRQADRSEHVRVSALLLLLCQTDLCPAPALALPHHCSWWQASPSHCFNGALPASLSATESLLTTLLLAR